MGLLIWGGGSGGDLLIRGRGSGVANLGGGDLLIRGRGSGVANLGGGGLADTREGKWGC